MFVGDPEYWYAIYHYFHESIHNGTLALWNPYMNGGEPFWPTTSMWRMLDPVNVFMALTVARLHNISLFSLYHVYFLLNIAGSLAGSYLVFRHLLLENRQSRGTENVLLLALLFAFFAHIAFSYFLNDAYHASLYTLPYVVYFLMRFFEGKRIKDYLFATYFTGLYIGSAAYHFILGLVCLACFVMITALRNRKHVLRESLNYCLDHKLAVAVSLIYLLLMCLPMLATYLEAGNLYPIARTSNDRALFDNQSISSFRFRYEEIMSTGWFIDFKETLRYVLHYPGFSPGSSFNFLACILVPLFFLGLFKGRNRWKMHFVAILSIALITMLGPHTPLHKVLCSIFPPLNLIRNGGFYLYYLFFAYTYFIVLGFSSLSEYVLKSNRKERIVKIISACLLVLLTASIVNIATGRSLVSHTVKVRTRFADFAPHAAPFRLIGERIFAMPRTAYYLLEPILYKQNAALQMIATQPSGMAPEALPYYREWDKLAAKDRCGAAYGIRTFFWTKNYYNIYRLGEKDIDIFKAFMGVERATVTFRENIMVLSDNEAGELATRIGGRGLYALLDKAVILDRNPVPDHAPAPDTDQPNDNGARFGYSVVSYKPDNIRLQVNNDRAGVLILRDGFHKDWHARVDGKETDVLRANVGFKGVYLPPGRHEVVFRYLPVLYLFGFYAFVSLSFAFPFLIVWLCKFERIRKKR